MENLLMMIYIVSYDNESVNECDNECNNESDNYEN